MLRRKSPPSSLLPWNLARRRLLRLLPGIALSGLAACDASDKPAGPVYADQPAAGGKPILRFAVHPLHNPEKLAKSYQPLMDLLNRGLVEVRLVLEASRDYAVYEEKFRQRGPAFLLPNPWQTLEAIKVGYQVIAMAGEPADFKGLILVRKDGGIRDLADLRGRAVSYPAATALAACIMPQAFFQRHGLDVMHDVQNRYVGSQESSIMNVYLGQTAAGATWPPPWRAFQRDHPQEAAALTVAWETGSLVNNSVMVRKDVPAAVTAKVRAMLLQLGETEQGLRILREIQTARFLPASDGDYDVVRRFIEDFERTVRKVEDRR